MGFYEELSKYYDVIFPAGEEQVSFLKEIAGKPPKAVLDIACGSGGYSVELAKLGYQVTASDLDKEMLNRLDCKASAGELPIKLLHANMLDLESKLTDKYNLAFCIGNSIVHLENLQQIQKFLAGARNLLQPDGGLVIQIINFDRILLRDIKSLPLIEDKKSGLTFERNYDYDRQKNIIYFKTRLNAGVNSYDNEIPLYPLLQDELISALSQAGFKKVKLFGDFNGNEFDKYNSFMLVLWAR
jgi:ubiquinone/menaquinone biosynthesis C-methylase UbiE